MLLKIANLARSRLVLTMLAWGLVAGNAVPSTRAQETRAEFAKSIDVEVEVWEIGDPGAADWEALKRLGGDFVRMKMLAQLREPKTEQRPPTRFSLKASDRQFNRVQTEIDTTSSLQLDFKPGLVGRDAIMLDYDLVRRTQHGEVKISAKQQVKFGTLMMQWIKPKAADDKENPEKALLVFLFPRQRNADLSEVVVPVDFRQEANPLGVALFPRPGRFEMQVSEGWSGHLLAGTEYVPIVTLSGTTNIGKSKDARASDNHVRLEAFQAERPVLEVVYTDDGLIEVVARRTGVAMLTYQVTGLDGKPAACDLRIVVVAETTEINRAIKEVLPQSSIKVTNIKDAAVLTGTVDKEDDLKLLLEVAEQFYPKVIHRVKVALDVNQAELRPGNGDSVAPPTRIAPAIQTSATSLPASDTEPQRIIPSARAEAPRNRPRRRDAAELKALRDDVRGLRDDVRRLSELLEKRLAMQNQPPFAKAKDEDLLSLERSDRVETQVQPNGLLNFTAAWCQPCQRMSPLIRKLVREGHAIQTIDVDKDAELARKFKVESIPCFIRIKEGREVDRILGSVDEHKLRSLLTDRRSAKYGSANAIQTGLQKLVSLDFQEAPLKDVIRKISAMMGVNFVFDPQSLEEAGRTATDPVTISIEGITARSALKLILEPLNLAFVAEDEVLKIVSRQRAKGELIVTTYSVADVLPLLPDDDVKPSVKPKLPAEQNAKGLSGLIQIIQSTVSPDSWDVVGGPASVRAHEATLSLVVRQTCDVHAELQELLQQIRRLKRLPKSVSKTDDSSLVVKTYAVADLVMTLPDEAGDRTKYGASNWLKLFDKITEIEPDKWTANGGRCSIQVNEKTLSLVIRATPDLHQAINDLLNRLRRDQDVQVCVAIRLLQVADESKLQKAGLKFDFDPRTGAARLNEREAKQLITAIDALHGEVLFAPKITIFSGQIAYVGSDDSRDRNDKLPGFQIHVRGQVAKDGSGVRLNVALNPESLITELTRNSHLLPDGGYLLLDMTDRLSSSKHDADLKGGKGLLPDQNDQLHPVPREKVAGRMLILLQPSIVVPEAEEE